MVKAYCVAGSAQWSNFVLGGGASTADIGAAIAAEADVRCPAQALWSRLSPPRAGQVMVASIEVRKAPEHPHPAAYQDTVEAVKVSCDAVCVSDLRRRVAAATQ
jgi:hypothetical protein